MPNKGLEAKPGDRGDATRSSGMSKVKTGNSGKLQAPCSKGYEDAPSGWGGNVKR